MLLFDVKQFQSPKIDVKYFICLFDCLLIPCEQHKGTFEAKSNQITNEQKQNEIRREKK